LCFLIFTVSLISSPSLFFLFLLSVFFLMYILLSHCKYNSLWNT
jgi:hypothetical protein